MLFSSSSRAAVLAAAAVLVTVIAGCDSGPSATSARDQSRTAMDEAAAAARANQGRMEGGSTSVADAEDAPLYQGKPLWSANRKYTAQENAAYHFKRNGADFGARDVDAFVAKAHAFVGDPPKGALTMTRANGDTLIYDAKTNVFAVANSEGAPRTMFKPDDGMAYWEKQKERETQSASRKRNDGEG